MAVACSTTASQHINFNSSSCDMLGPSQLASGRAITNAVRLYVGCAGHELSWIPCESARVLLGARFGRKTSETRRCLARPLRNTKRGLQLDFLGCLRRSFPTRFVSWASPLSRARPWGPKFIRKPKVVDDLRSDSTDFAHAAKARSRHSPRRPWMPPVA